jgi:hypothetical protein
LREVTARGLPPREDDPVHAPNAQIGLKNSIFRIDRD